MNAAAPLLLDQVADSIDQMLQMLNARMILNISLICLLVKQTTMRLS